MSLGYLWAYGTTLGARPFAYFAPLISLATFNVIVFVITALKQIFENKNQHILW